LGFSTAHHRQHTRMAAASSYCVAERVDQMGNQVGGGWVRWDGRGDGVLFGGQDVLVGHPV
ncbi:MAG: hypothetical protein QGH20_04100, partial [Candidatus Latescibacteria bacterium]|nr:hypothetical protein [Candidatus Latescibacterota bacterium]